MSKPAVVHTCTLYKPLIGSRARGGSPLVGTTTRVTQRFFAYVFDLKRFFAFRFLVFVPRWWAQVDSNHRPHAYQACALTT